MPEKQKNAKKARDHKESKHQHGGGGKVRLNELQKILLVNGGMGHHLRRGKKRVETENTKHGQKMIEAAKTAREAEKKRERERKAAAKATRLVSLGAVKQ